MKIIEKVIDIETGEEIITERDETAQEQAKRKAFEAEMAEEKAKADAKASAKAALLAQLGITEEQAKLLLS